MNQLLFVKNIDHGNMAAFCSKDCLLGAATLTRDHYSDIKEYTPTDSFAPSCIHCVYCNDLLNAPPDCIICQGVTCKYLRNANSLVMTAFLLYLKDILGVPEERLTSKAKNDLLTIYWPLLKAIRFNLVATSLTQDGSII